MIKIETIDKKLVKHVMMTLKATCYNAKRHQQWDDGWEELGFGSPSDFIMHEVEVQRLASGLGIKQKVLLNIPHLPGAHNISVFVNKKQKGLPQVQITCSISKSISDKKMKEAVIDTLTILKEEIKKVKK